MSREGYVRRLHIIGGPGSGKSTLARHLGRVFDVPVFELDGIAFEGEHFRERPLQFRINDLENIISRPVWITDGIFIEWIDPLAQAADVILWLDTVTWQVASLNILKRFASRGVSETRTRTGHQKFSRVGDYQRHLRQLRAVMAMTRAYYTASEAPRGDIRNVTRAQTRVYLERYAGKVLYCKHAGELEPLLGALTNPKGLCDDSVARDPSGLRR